MIPDPSCPVCMSLAESPNETNERSYLGGYLTGFVATRLMGGNAWKPLCLRHLNDVRAIIRAMPPSFVASLSENVRRELKAFGTLYVVPKIASTRH